MKRLFIAIPVQESPELNNLTNSLVKIAPAHKIKWVDARQYHLTLKFLGDVDKKNIPAIEDILSAIAEKNDPFSFKLIEPGFFTNRKGFMRVIHMGIKPVAPFESLHQSIEEDLAEAGFDFQNNNFKPHLTLGRTKNKFDEHKIRALIEEYENTVLSDHVANHFNLTESILTKKGPYYQAIKTFYL